MGILFIKNRIHEANKNHVQVGVICYAMFGTLCT